MQKQTGWASIALIVVLAAAGFTAVLTYNNAISRAHAAEAENRELKGDLEREKGKREAAAIRSDAEKERLIASHERQSANKVRAAEKVRKANASKIAETSARDAERYTKFVVEKALPRNIKAINCRSDLSTVNDPAACPYTVR